MSQYSIVVEVPEPKDSIFIARPFSSDFDGIRDAILRAIVGVISFNSSGTNTIFVPTGTDLNPEITTNFIKEIVEKTREARVVVAVCSQELDTKKPNPNVMYELGFARSIGKPTVIMMREGERLLADLQGNQVLFYKQGSEQAIVSELTRVLTSLLGVSNKTRLIDEVCYKDIWVGSPHNWMILKSNLWNDFLTILKFAKAVHELFFTFYSSQVNPLLAAVEVIYVGTVVTTEEQRKRRVTCTNAWNEYSNKYDTAEKDFFISHARNQQMVNQALQELRHNITDENTEDLLNSIQAYLDKLSNQLVKFFQTHDDILGTLPQNGLIINIIGTPEIIERIWGLLGILSQVCHGLTSNADSLIKDLIELLLETERSHT